MKTENDILKIYDCPQSGKSSRYMHVTIPELLYSELGNPTHISIHEFPLRLSLPTLGTQKTRKVSINNKGAMSIRAIPINDISEYVGTYRYEIEDCTIHLEKIN